MPRLGYNKSRAGCLRCKQRRVKCDEKRPCGACTRHGIRCSLLDVPEDEDAPSPDRPLGRRLREPKTSGKHPESSLQHRARPLAPAKASMPGSSVVPSEASLESPSSVSSPDNFPYFSKYMTGQPQQQPVTWMTDLELMHHYSISAYLALPRGLELRHIWTVEVPALALAYEFLMHQILAMSAYHLAYLRPYNRAHYSIIASQHQNDAVRGLRAMLPQVNETNCHALFVTSSLLSITAFGTLSYPGEATDSHPDIDDFLDVCLLIRGMSHLLDSHLDFIERGPLNKFLSLGTHESITPLLMSITDRLKKLRIPANEDVGAQTVCQAEVTTLIQWIDHACISSEVPELRTSMTWPIGMTEGYLDLLRRRHPAALIVLGYYCIILNSAGSRFWFLKGWGESILKDASRSSQPGWSRATIPDDLYRAATDMNAVDGAD